MLTSTELLPSIKLRAYWPTDGGPFTDAELLLLATAELRSEIFPLVLSAKEDYGVFDSDTALVADRRDYRIPKRAHGGRLRDLVLVSSSGKESSVPVVDAEDVVQGDVASSARYVASFRGDTVSLDPVPSGSPTSSLRFRYYVRPSALVADTRRAVVESINRSAGTVSVNDTAYTASGMDNTADTYDFLADGGSYAVIGMDLESSTDAGGVLTFDADDIPDALEVGDWLVRAEESPFPQIPDFACELLAQRTAARALEMRGEAAAADRALGIYAQMVERFMATIDSRIDGEDRPVIPRWSPMRAMRGM